MIFHLNLLLYFAHVTFRIYMKHFLQCALYNMLDNIKKQIHSHSDIGFCSHKEILEISVGFVSLECDIILHITLTNFMLFTSFQSVTSCSHAKEQLLLSKKNWFEDSFSWKLVFVMICKYFAKDIIMTSIGESAFTSHVNGRKYKDRARSWSKFILDSMLPSTLTCNDSKESSSKESEEKQGEIDLILASSFTLFALHYLRLLNIVRSKYYMSSSTASRSLFAAMFPDSSITKSFQCSHTCCEKSLIFT